MAPTSRMVLSRGENQLRGESEGMGGVDARRTAVAVEEPSLMDGGCLSTSHLLVRGSRSKCSSGRKARRCVLCLKATRGPAKPSRRPDRFTCYQALLLSSRRSSEYHGILAPTSRAVVGINYAGKNVGKLGGADAQEAERSVSSL